MNSAKIAQRALVCHSTFVVELLHHVIDICTGPLIKSKDVAISIAILMYGHLIDYLV